MKNIKDPCPEGLTPLISETRLQARVKDLAKEILHDHKQETSLILIGVLKGAYVFLADLGRALSPFPIQMDFFQTSSYGMKTKTSRNVQIIRDIQFDVFGKAVILVEDIMDSGYTIAYLKKIMEQRGAKSVKICSMLDKPSRREVDIQADYIGFTVPNHFVVGYGMDACEDYRHLPIVAYIPEEMELKGETE
ncbi:MAG TPA: hypoxanthine phosphoribosyltransferase [Caldisericia bacterium]|jgi:hypoxanthine phosphoribosyltransferase|nr:hypoxanthine phosphoribosyltransferase [Caldisericia bacterium]